MLEFQFKEISKRVDQLCQQTVEIFSNCPEEEIKKLIFEFEQFLTEYRKQTRLTIAFIGQYNAGKSTLIKALTGDPGVRISAEICTDKVSEYVWEDVLLLDTPGVYAGMTEHNQITLDRISKCDLLVFVVPNELFNPQGALFFKEVADKMQRVGQMVLVVNKMSRETGTPEILLESIQEVIEPYFSNDFYTCFIDADSYLKSQDDRYIKHQQILRQKANFDDFLKALHTLIKRNNLTARLITPLHRAMDLLEKTNNHLSVDSKTERNLLEILRRKALLFRASEIRFRNAYREELSKLEHEIIMIGDGVASLVDGYHSEDQLHSEISEAEQKLDLSSRQTQETIQSILEQEFSRLQTQLEELEQSPLGRELAEEFQFNAVDGKKIGDFKVNQQSKFPDFFVAKGSEVLKGVGKFASNTSRDLVYNIGKAIGMKFKPYGAYKAAKFIRGLGPIFAVGGVVLDYYLLAKQEQDEEQTKQKLSHARAEMRKSFREVAIEIKNEYEIIIEDLIEQSYAKQQFDIGLRQTELRNEDQSNARILESIKTLHQAVQQQIAALTKL